MDRTDLLIYRWHEFQETAEYWFRSSPQETTEINGSLPGRHYRKKSAEIRPCDRCAFMVYTLGKQIRARCYGFEGM